MNYYSWDLIKFGQIWGFSGFWSKSGKSLNHHDQDQSSWPIRISPLTHNTYLTHKTLLKRTTTRWGCYFWTHFTQLDDRTKHKNPLGLSAHIISKTPPPLPRGNSRGLFNHMAWCSGCFSVGSPGQFSRDDRCLEEMLNVRTKPQADNVPTHATIRIIKNMIYWS